MKNILKLITATTITALALFLPPPVAFALECVCDIQYTDGTSETKDGASATIFGDENGCFCGGPDGDGISYLLNFLLNALTFGVGALAVLGFIIVGIQFITARDNPAALTAAKNRALNTTIGLVAYLLFWSVLEFLIPGGLLNRPSSGGKEVASITSRLAERTPTPVPGSSSSSSTSGSHSSSSSTPAAPISDLSAALPYVQRFIQDTNTRYGRSYTIPTSIPGYNVKLGTPGDDYKPASGGGCWNSTYGCGQCTAVSGWFIEKLTSYQNGSGNGTQVVRNLHSQNPSVDILYAASGQFPSGMAVFSTIGYMHTGVILGKDSSGKYITFEGNADLSNQLVIRLRDSSYFTSNSAEFFPVENVRSPSSSAVGSSTPGASTRAGTYQNTKTGTVFNTYYQCDAPWGSKPGNGSGTVCDNTCNMISSAVVSSAKNHMVDPETLLNDGQKNVMPATSVQKYTDMTCSYTTSSVKQRTIDALQGGSVAIIMINRNNRGGTQHYMALLDISADGGQVYVGNGISRNNSSGFNAPGWYNTNDVLKNVYEATICK